MHLACRTIQALSSPHAEGPFRRFLRLLTAAMLLTATAADSPGASAVENSTSDRMEGSAVNGWVRPTLDGRSDPLWGHTLGLRVGLHPLQGPRGLLRVYAPYLGQPENQVINYLAVEPVPAAETNRGLSELEFSRLDNKPGKRIWSGADRDDWSPQLPNAPAAGWIEQVDGVEHLRVWVFVEPFDNGAKVYLRVSFRADRPHAVGIATFARNDSKPLAHCIVTATMGNYARLRKLQLADQTASPSQLWPNFSETGFTSHASFPLAALVRTPQGHALGIATPDELEPAKASYDPMTRSHWHYVGARASQCWRSCRPDDRLKLQVNGRRVYWGSKAPIPGGVAFENFEMVAPFRQGDEFWFEVEPLAPEHSRQRG